MLLRKHCCPCVCLQVGEMVAFIQAQRELSFGFPDSCCVGCFLVPLVRPKIWFVRRETCSMKPSKGVNPALLSAFSFSQTGVWDLGTDKQVLMASIDPFSSNKQRKEAVRGGSCRAWPAPHTLHSPAPDCIPFPRQDFPQLSPGLHH